MQQRKHRVILIISYRFHLLKVLQIASTWSEKNWNFASLNIKY